jgi:hypothetical protein
MPRLLFRLITARGMTTDMGVHDAPRDNYLPPNSRSISQPSRPAAASGRADVRVGAGRLVALTGNGTGGADAVGAAEGALTCEATCARFEKKPACCEFGRLATGTP